MDKILVTITGGGMIAFIWWFFFGKKSDEDINLDVSGEIDITVDGGYKPSVIKIPLGKKVRLNFSRKDPNTCLEEVIISDYKIKKFLPVGESVSVSFTPEKRGTLPFQCSMNMYHGKIIVE